MSSPNTRAKETARIVAKTVGYPPEKIVIEAKLQEENFGPVEGLSFSRFKEALGPTSRFIGGVPGGESGNQVMERMSCLFSGIANLSELHGKTVVCFSHWFPIAQALRISGFAVESLDDRKVLNGEAISSRLPQF